MVRRHGNALVRLEADDGLSVCCVGEVVAERGDAVRDDAGGLPCCEVPGEVHLARFDFVAELAGQGLEADFVEGGGVAAVLGRCNSWLVNVLDVWGCVGGYGHVEVLVHVGVQVLCASLELPVLENIHGKISGDALLFYVSTIQRSPARLVSINSLATLSCLPRAVMSHC